MYPSTDEDLDNLSHVIITSDGIWDPTVLDHSTDFAMDSMIDAEDFTFFSNHTSMTGMYLHHKSNGPNYVCNVYYIE